MSTELQPSGSIPLAACAVVALFAAGFGLGRLIVGRVGAVRWPWAAAAVRLTIGLNLLALLGMVLGLTGALAGGRSLWLLAVAAAINLVDLRQAWERAREQDQASARVKSAHRAVRGRKRSRGARALAAVLVVFTLGPALCYPDGWDELTYHAELPRRWLAAGWPEFYTDLPYSGFPSLGETLLWLGGPIEHVIAAKLLIWSCWIVALFMLFSLLRRGLAAGSAMLLIFAFAISSTVLLISANCYVESILMLDSAALLLAASVPHRLFEGLPKRAPAVVLGVLAGGAAAVKLSGLPLLVLPLLWRLGEFRLSRAGRSAAVRSAAIYLAVAVCVAAPFYARPWTLSGNPFYPFYGEWFSSDEALIAMSRYHHDIGGAPFGVRTPATFVCGPVLMALNEELYDGSFGWQLPCFIAIAAAGALAVGPRRRRRLIGSLAAAVWLYLFWFLTAQQARFLIPSILAMTIIAAAGLHSFHRRKRKAALALVMLASLASVPWQTAPFYLSSWLAAIGIVNTTDFVDEGTGFDYLPLVRELRTLPADARLLLLFEHRGFYLPRSHTIGTPLFQERFFTPPEEFSEPEKIIDAIRQGKFTHVVMGRAPMGPDRVMADRFDSFLRAMERCVNEGRLEIVWQSERYVILRTTDSRTADAWQKHYILTRRKYNGSSPNSRVGALY